MLATYPEMFGRRFMAGVRDFKHNNALPDLCWLLEIPPSKPSIPRPLTPNRPMSRKEMRKHRKTMSKSSVTLDHTNQTNQTA